MGAMLGIAVARSFRFEAVARAGEAVANKEKRRRSSPSKSLLAARCPVTGDGVSKDVSIDYRGGKLCFCGAECRDAFKADPAEYEAKANAQLVITGQFKQTKCPRTGDEFVPAIKMKVCGVDVHFSSTESLNEVKRAAADKRAELVFGKSFGVAFARKLENLAVNEPSAAEPADAWECKACGYVHKGSAPPTTCPKCGEPASVFRPVRRASRN